jgi:hypothetical protein
MLGGIGERAARPARKRLHGQLIGFVGATSPSTACTSAGVVRQRSRTRSGPSTTPRFSAASTPAGARVAFVGVGEEYGERLAVPLDNDKARLVGHRKVPPSVSRAGRGAAPPFYGALPEATFTPGAPSLQPGSAQLDAAHPGAAGNRRNSRDHHSVDAALVAAVKEGRSRAPREHQR